MRKKSILVLLCFVLFISACGKKEENISSGDSSRDERGYVQTGEGLLYRYQVPGLYTRLEYYDYGSNTYMPLCVRANCTHDTEECAAVRLGNTSTIGRLGGKWYYFNPTAPVQTWDYNEATGGWTFNGSTSRPYGSMYQNEMTPDGYQVDENGAWVQ